MPIAEAGGERLYYEITGEGPPLVLIRGLSRSLRFWEPILPHLASHFRLFLYDHRGIGRSEISGKRFDIKDMADDLSALLTSTGFGSAHVFGLSLGGMVAQQLAIRHPEQVEKLVLGATWAGGPKSRFPRVDTLLKLIFYSATLPVDLSVKMQGPLLMSPAHHRAHPETARSWASNLQLEPIDPKVVLFQALGGARHDAWRSLDKVSHSTLILHGDKDRLINVKNAEVLKQRIKNAQKSIFAGRGHDLVAEAPEEVARHLREFLLPA